MAQNPPEYNMTGIDYATAYAAMQKDAEVPPPDARI